MVDPSPEHGRKLEANVTRMGKFIDLKLSLTAAEQAKAEFLALEGVWKEDPTDPRVHASLVRVRTAFNVVASYAGDILAAELAAAE